MRRGLTAALAAGLVATATTVAAQPDFGMADPHWVPWAELGGFYGPGGAARGEAALWAPLFQTPISLGFVEVRGKLFIVDTKEANLAFGFRRMLPIGINLGLWGGYDLRHTAAGSLFHQLSGGVEVLGERFAFRANGYFPLNNTAVTGTTITPADPAIRLYNNNTAIGLFTDTVTATTRELALYGVDAEVGVGLPVAERNGRRHELWLHGGGFYFDHALLAGAVAGPKARAEWRVDNIFAAMPGSRLSFETEASYDAVRGTRWEAGLRLRLPLSPAADEPAMSRQQLRMAEALERDTDIVSTSIVSETLQIDETPEPVEDPLTGTRIDRVAFGSTAQSLLDAVALGGNTLIIAQGGNGLIDLTASEGLALFMDQVLQGGGSTIEFRGIQSGIARAFTAPGTRPELFSAGTTNLDRGVVTVATRTHVVGLDIYGDLACLCGFSNGIAGGDDLHTVVIEQNYVGQVADFGVFFGRRNADILIRDNTLMEIGGGGIGFDLHNSRIGIDNNAIIDSFYGVLLIRDNSDVWVTGNQFSDLFIASSAFERNSNLLFADNTVNNVTAGFTFGDRNRGVEIADNRFSDAGIVAIAFNNNNDDVTIAGNLTETTANGVGFGQRNTDVVVTGNQFNLNSPLGGDGIFFGDNNDGISILANSIINAVTNGIVLLNRNNAVTIEGNTITNIGADAIHIDDRNTAVTITENLINGAVVDDGLRIGRNNQLTVTDNRFEAAFGDDVVDIDNNNNTLAGAANSFTGTVADQFCEVTGAQVGTIGFAVPAATCP